jgi:hypothetical protein
MANQKIEKVGAIQRIKNSYWGLTVLVGARRAFGVGMKENMWLWAAATFVVFLLQWGIAGWTDALGAGRDTLVATVTFTLVYWVWHALKIPPEINAVLRAGNVWSDLHSSVEANIQKGWAVLGSVSPAKPSEEFDAERQGWEDGVIKLFSDLQMPPMLERQFNDIGMHTNAWTTAFMQSNSPTEEWAKAINSSNFPDQAHKKALQDSCFQIRAKIQRLESIKEHCFKSFMEQHGRLGK